ncbi:glycosyltransferase family 4 protein [bacterium]|nr:glycosyltransferase family 4 protein [bacterium]
MKAHLLVIADGRSPTARNWIANLQALDYGVSLVSTFPCQPPDDLLHTITLPVAFSRFSSGGQTPDPDRPQTTTSPQPFGFRRLVRRFAPLVQGLRYRLGPLTLRRFVKPYLAFIEQIQPDLVHALRIPYEGMLGSATPAGIPFIAATWGNDLTLHAEGSPGMSSLTRRCLRRADGLTSDTHRDVRLAHEWGLPNDAPTLVVPGSGGLDLDAIASADPEDFDSAVFGIPDDRPWVVNPRGLRPGSVHQEVFFQSIPKILAEIPETVFLCPNLAGVRQAEGWVEQLGIRESVFLLPRLPQSRLWALFKRAQVFASPSSHDGTPNTLLEAMACGCYPVAGRIESLAEWIEPGRNGALVDPRDPYALAGAILTALRTPKIRAESAAYNQDLIHRRAAQSATRPRIDAFYQQFLR